MPPGRTASRTTWRGHGISHGKCSASGSGRSSAGPFFLGKRFSLADLTLAYWLAYAEQHGMLSRFPPLAALLDAARSRPAVAPVLARQDAWIRRRVERVRGA